ncbi:MAG: dynamin family protein [Oscillospiraceae bacterium]|nr:dynamin family protein [Oscillospiraceae bacterium]
MSCEDNILQIIKKIVNVTPEQFTAANISQLEEIIKVKIPQTMKEHAPMNFPQLYDDFCSEYERFKEFILFEPLIGKTVVALGGGFSSGKSTFLNSLMSSFSSETGKKANILPSAINPSTSVPTYIVHSDSGSSAYGYNIFNSKVNLDIEDIKPISHGFGRNDEDDGDRGIQMGQMLKTIFASTPSQPFENIAFLDTPGYSKAETLEHTNKTDENIARQQLNSADCILWFIDCDRGTFPEDDIRFLKSLENKSAPLLIIVNKADKKTESDLRDIVGTIRNIAKQRGISCADVLAFSRKKGTEDKFDRAKIINMLKGWNKPVRESNFAYNFSLLFIKCRDYTDECISTEKHKVGSLKKALTLAESDDVINILRDLTSDSTLKLAEMKQMRSSLENLRNEFFTELRRVASVIGIRLPEADEMKMAYEKMLESGTNPLKAAEECCKNKKNDNSNAYYDSISSGFGGISLSDPDDSETETRHYSNICGKMKNIKQRASVFDSLNSAFDKTDTAKSTAVSTLDKLNSLF